ncbi:MAG TPA: hypothetical protein VMI72_17580 [Roseiarcus sp.]|nr:hypothetical protein [Roseiarcus sp.]
MASNPKDAAAASLSAQWWRIPIYDPGPPWWFEAVDEQIKHQLILEQINAQKEILQAHLNSLNRQAEILARKR